MFIEGKKVLVIYENQICKVLQTQLNYFLVINKKLSVLERQNKIKKIIKELGENYGNNN